MSNSTSPEVGDKLSDSDLVSAIALVMAVIITILCLAVIFGFCFHMYAKWLSHRRQEGGNTNAAPPSRWRRRFDFAGGRQETVVATIHCHGLDPSVLKTLPIMVFKKDFEDEIECSVCLSNVCEGEKARFLPICNHGFHMECIDMWFKSHATCPLCRIPVSGKYDKKPNQESSSTTTMDGELRIQVEDNARMFPTNVLLYGNESEISLFGQLADVNQCVSSQFPSASVTTSASSSASTTSSDSNRAEGMLAIDIPSQVNEEEVKSPVTPRLRSFVRLLSRDSRRINPSSTHDLDVEQEG